MQNIGFLKVRGLKVENFVDGATIYRRCARIRQISIGEIEASLRVKHPLVNQ